MKTKTKKILGWLTWLFFGLFSMVLGWTHFLIYVIGTYLYVIFIEGVKE